MSYGILRIIKCQIQPQMTNVSLRMSGDDRFGMTNVKGDSCHTGADSMLVCSLRQHGQLRGKNPVET